jgi:hypothetical protein
MPTEQEVYDKTWEHLVTQGKPASGLGGCYYRTADGLKCAFGFWIKDNQYDPKMENRSASSVIHLYGLREFGDKTELMDKLQRCHDLCSQLDDGTFDMEELRLMFRAVAAEFGLSDAVTRQEVTA